MKKLLLNFQLFTINFYAKPLFLALFNFYWQNKKYTCFCGSKFQPAYHTLHYQAV